jgi:hypothetical protein
VPVSTKLFSDQTAATVPDIMNQPTYIPLYHHLKNPHQTFCCDEDGISALSQIFVCLFLAFSSPGTLVQNAGVLELLCQPESHLHHTMIDN